MNRYAPFSLSAFLILISLPLLFGEENIIPVILAVFIHEISHCIAIILCKGKIDGLCVSGLGLIINHRGLSYRTEAVSALAGPFGGILFAILVARFFDHASAYYTAGLSLAMSVFNLLPVMPMDGGLFLYSIFSVRYDEGKAFRIVRSLGLVVCTVLGFGSVIVAVQTGHISLLISSIWVIITYCKYYKDSIK